MDLKRISQTPHGELVTKSATTSSKPSFLISILLLFMVDPSKTDVPIAARREPTRAELALSEQFSGHQRRSRRVSTTSDFKRFVANVRSDRRDQIAPSGLLPVCLAGVNGVTEIGPLEGRRMGLILGRPLRTGERRPAYAPFEETPARLKPASPRRLQHTRCQAGPPFGPTTWRQHGP